MNTNKRREAQTTDTFCSPALYIHSHATISIRLLFRILCFFPCPFHFIQSNSWHMTQMLFKTWHENITRTKPIDAAHSGTRDIVSRAGRGGKGGFCKDLTSIESWRRSFLFYIPISLHIWHDLCCVAPVFSLSINSLAPSRPLFCLGFSDFSCFGWTRYWDPGQSLSHVLVFFSLYFLLLSLCLSHPLLLPSVDSSLRRRYRILTTLRAGLDLANGSGRQRKGWEPKANCKTTR